MGKPQEDLRDINIIAEEIAKFAKMTFLEYKLHIKDHPEDKMHYLDIPTHGHMPMSREAALRFHQLAERQRAVDSDPDSLDVEAIDRALRAGFVETFIIKRRPYDERKWIDRILARAVKRAKQRHESITYYFPCVVTAKGDPPEFVIGPVRFFSTEKFFLDFGDKILADDKEANKRQRDELKKLIAERKYFPEKELGEEERARLDKLFIDWIYEYYKSYAWIAEVTVPICDPKVSRARAETTVQAALDILKLFFGSYGGRDLRIGHDRGYSKKTASLARGPDGIFRPSIGQRGEGALLDAGWYEQMVKQNAWILQAAGSAIEGYLNPRNKSHHRDRWLDALNWYGQAVSERLPSAKLVKYVAALERLTVTPKDHPNENCRQELTDIVTRRTALLTVRSYKPNLLKRARENARKLYRWRSDLMHGRSSPLSREVSSLIHLAHEIVQDAIFNALGHFVDLEISNHRAAQDLYVRYQQLEKCLPPE
jgi:hypothetical protein